jgi:hypothetical protein
MNFGNNYLLKVGKNIYDIQVHSKTLKGESSDQKDADNFTLCLLC